MMQYHNKYLSTMKMMNLKMLMVVVLLFSWRCSSLKLQHKQIVGPNLFSGYVTEVKFLKEPLYKQSFESLFTTSFLSKYGQWLYISIKNCNYPLKFHFFIEKGSDKIEFDYQILSDEADSELLSDICNGVVYLENITEYLKSITKIKQEGETWIFSNKEGPVFQVLVYNPEG